MGPTGSAFAVAGDWTNNTGIGAFTAGTGTVALGGTSAQAVGGSSSTTFTNLTISNAAGITLGADVRVNGVLTLTSGVITTGARVVYVPSGGSVSRTSGHVNGNLRKFVADRVAERHLRGRRRDQLQPRAWWRSPTSPQRATSRSARPPATSRSSPRRRSTRRAWPTATGP